MDDDDDLDQELLDLMGSSATTAATSATAKSRAKPAKQRAKRKRKRSSDSESEDEESSEEESDYALTESESENGEDSDMELELGAMPEELSESELAGLTEFEREARISEYAEKRQQYMERLVVKQRLQSERKDKAKRQRTTRDSTASRKKANKKLEELKARRSKGKKANLDEALEEVEQQLPDFSDEDETYADRIRSTYTNEKRPSEADLPTLADLNAARLTRDQLEKWMYTTFFDDVAVGAFVRLGVGIDRNKQQTYRVAEILEVTKYHRIYKVNGSQTNKALKLKHGKAEKAFLMDVISNSPFTEAECERWLKTMKAEKQRLPHKRKLQEKSKTIKEAEQRIFTNEEIDAMLKEKKESLSNLPKNLAREKVELMHKREELQQQGKDTTELDYLIQDVEAAIEEAKSDSKLDVWTKLNERNRKANLTEGSQAEVIARQAKTKDTNKSKTDPFARIKVVPTHVFVTPGPNKEIVPPSPMDGSTPVTPKHLTPPKATSPINISNDQVKTMSTNGTAALDDLYADIEVDIDI